MKCVSSRTNRFGDVERLPRRDGKSHVRYGMKNGFSNRSAGNSITYSENRNPANIGDARSGFTA